jgi:hypothetical protein
LFLLKQKSVFCVASKRKQLEAKRTIWCELSKKKQKNESVSFACSSRSKNLFFAKPAHPNFYYTSKTEHRCITVTIIASVLVCSLVETGHYQETT